MRRAQWGVLWRNSARALGRADISMCWLPPLLLWRVISIPKSRNVEARLFIRRLSTCSLTDDLLQPVVEIARRTFPRLASCFSMSVLTALTCSLPNPVRLWAPETARSGGAPSSGRCATACYPSRRAVHQHIDDEGLRAIQHERALTRDPTPNHEGTPPAPPMNAMHVAIRAENRKTAWGSMVHGASPARMGPAPWAKKIFAKNFC